MAATGIKKLKRSHLMHLLDSTFGGETPSWFLIGKNIEDMSMDLGPDTATVKNILDETDVNDNGYGGIMIWAISHDSPNKEESLLQVLYDAFTEH